MLTTFGTQRYEGWMGDWLRDLAPIWVKTVNASPYWAPPGGQKHCCRIWTDNIDAAYIERGREGGRDFVRHMWPRWQQNPAACYELWNEPDCNTNTGLANLREATLGAVDEATHLGVSVGVINASEGNPHDNGTGDPGVSAWKLAQLRPAIKAAADLGFPFLRHCYWRPQVEGPTGRWHALGRLAWDLEQLNIPNLRTLVTECGIDGGIAGYPGKQGWQKLTSESLYRQDFIDAERYARTLPGVEALMYFGFGAEEPWLSGGFDIPADFARSLITPLKALTAPPVTETVDRRLIIELARPLAYTPQTNKVTQWFGQGEGHYDAYGLHAHNGLDYRAPEGTPVLAAHPGIARCYDQGSAGLGRYVKLSYYDGQGECRYQTRYAHLSAFRVSDGQRVSRGQVLGLSGNTGNSTGAHLHFDLKVTCMSNPAYGDAIDPCPWRTV